MGIYHVQSTSQQIEQFLKNISKITFALEIDHGEFEKHLKELTSGDRLDIRKQEIHEAEVPQGFTAGLANELYESYKLYQE